MTARQRVVVVDVSRLRSLGHVPGVSLLCAALASVSEAEPRAETAFPHTAEPPPALDAAQILEPPGFELKLVRTRFTAYDQRGRGYQSQEGPRSGPGSETLRVFQTQAELQVAQGPDITHRLWVPVDIVTSASTNANDRYYAEPDIISTASAQTFGAEAEYRVSVREGGDNTWTGGVAGHQGETISAWRISLGYQRELANDNATLGLTLNQVLDWFPEFELGGNRLGRVSRSSSNINLQLSQLLSPTTVARASYGFTHQQGVLTSTWNSVPTLAGERVREQLPERRERHVASLALSQWLPWHGALHLDYRRYQDSWESLAHGIETRLLQEIGSWLLLGINYRYYTQNGVRYFTTATAADSTLHTADSDLAPFHAQTLGFSVAADLPSPPLGDLFLALGYDYYFRSNELTVDVATWASGFRF